MRRCLGSAASEFNLTRRRLPHPRQEPRPEWIVGAPKPTVDGKPVAGDLVPYAKPGATVIIDGEV